MNWSPAPRFAVKTFEEAQNIILTPEGDQTPQERWVAETDWLAPVLEQFLPEGLIVDYGCGVGRIPHACSPLYSWIGVDISTDMLRIGIGAQDPLRSIIWCQPAGFTQLTRHGMAADGAIAIWALQHVPDLRTAIKSIALGLKANAPFVVLNTDQRWLPDDRNGGWHDDGQQVWKMLEKYFTLDRVLQLDGGPISAAGRRFRVYRRHRTLRDGGRQQEEDDDG